jgi:hypothetical protein
MEPEGKKSFARWTPWGAEYLPHDLPLDLPPIRAGGLKHLWHGHPAHDSSRARRPCYLAQVAHTSPPLVMYAEIAKRDGFIQAANERNSVRLQPLIVATGLYSSPVPFLYHGTGGPR